MSDRYFVFSDETGHWCNQKFYIRSWVIISEDEHIKLKNKIELLKKISGRNNELKYTVGHDYTLFDDLEFDVYFTVTFCDDFNQRKFGLITHLNKQDEELFKVRDKDIKSKIINTVKGSIFLNIYEYYHIENVSKFFNENYSDKKLFFFIDSPQYQNRDWQELFLEAGLSCDNLKIVNKSEDFEGIQFADILAGAMVTILNKVERDSNFNEFEKFLFSKFSQGNGSVGKTYMNNPQIILWDPKHEPFIDKIKKIMERN